MGYVSIIICREGNHYSNQNEDHERHNSVNVRDVKEDVRMVHSPLDRLSGRSIHQRNFGRVVGRKYYVHMHFSLCHFL
jgi:acetone carboxylase gamma subunit